VDPFGLCEESRTSDGEDEITDCERFARFVEALAGQAESDAEFVELLGEALTGLQNGDIFAPIGDPSVFFGASGFRDVWVDDDNPARHYAAYVVAGFQLGVAAGTTIAVGRELPGACRVGCSARDVALGMIGASHGDQLRSVGGLIPPRINLFGGMRHKVAAWIRRDL